jgi:hypothetical protein
MLGMVTWNITNHFMEEYLAIAWMDLITAWKNSGSSEKSDC